MLKKFTTFCETSNSNLIFHLPTFPNALYLTFTSEIINDLMYENTSFNIDF